MNPNRIIVLGGGLLFVGFSLGCMSFSIGGRTQIVPPTQESALREEGVQRGKAFLPPGQEVCVYFPIPYASTPNLEFEDSESNIPFQIVDQKPDHFRLKNLSGRNADLPWKSRGILISTNGTDAGPPSATVSAPVPTPEQSTGMTRVP